MVQGEEDQVAGQVRGRLPERFPRLHGRCSPQGRKVYEYMAVLLDPQGLSLRLR